MVRPKTKWLITAGDIATTYEKFAKKLYSMIEQNDVIIAVKGTGAATYCLRFSAEYRIQYRQVKNQHVAMKDSNACIEFAGGKTTRRIARRARQKNMPVIKVDEPNLGYLRITPPKI